MENMGNSELVAQSGISCYQCCHLHSKSSRRLSEQSGEGSGAGSRQRRTQLEKHKASHFK